MRRIHIPNLFYIQGQALQGKSSLTRHFRKSLDCEVLHTDQIFWRWCDKYHPKETRDVRWALGRYFPYLPSNLRREWFEYLTNYALAVTKYAKPDMVMEGWLLTLLPKDLKEILYHRCTLMNVTMRHFVAHTAKKSFKPDGSDYTPVVEALKKRMSYENERHLMPNVKQQRFEDCKHCAGRSDCAGRLAAFNVLSDLEGKNVLEINCSTGYFSIRAAQYGAHVWATNTNEDQVRLASRIANAIYRLPGIRYYHGDILKEDFRKAPKFDYILAINGVMVMAQPELLFKRAHELLAPDGKLLVEIATPRLDSGNPLRDRVPYFKEVPYKNEILRCPNEKTIQFLARGFTLTQRTRSVPPTNSLLTRIAYTFTKGGDGGLNNWDLCDCKLPDRSEEKVRTVDLVPEPKVVSVHQHLPQPAESAPHERTDRLSQFEELSGLEHRE